MKQVTNKEDSILEPIVVKLGKGDVKVLEIWVDHDAKLQTLGSYFTAVFPESFKSLILKEKM